MTYGPFPQGRDSLRFCLAARNREISRGKSRFLARELVEPRARNRSISCEIFVSRAWIVARLARESIPLERYHLSWQLKWNEKKIKWNDLRVATKNIWRRRAVSSSVSTKAFENCFLCKHILQFLVIKILYKKYVLYIYDFLTQFYNSSHSHWQEFLTL